jgi:hypothetical protein
MEKAVEGTSERQRNARRRLEILTPAERRIAEAIGTGAAGRRVTTGLNGPHRERRTPRPNPLAAAPTTGTWAATGSRQVQESTFAG